MMPPSPGPLAAAPAPRRPSLSLVQPAAEANPRVVLWALIALCLLPRLAVLPINENFLGDAVVRTEFAERWARHPHWMSSYQDGAFQFGPLHLYLVGLVLKAGVVRTLAGRLLSVLFGTLTVLPLYALTRRLFGWRAGVWACAALSLWGMHIQFSTTAASEALALFLCVWAMALLARALDEPRVTPLFGAALLMNLACATRYDAWMMVPLLTVLLFVASRDTVAGLTRAVLFGLMCLPFPLLWMQGNAVAMGDALYPLHEINRFHAAWVNEGFSRWGQLYRVINLFFWPGTAVFTLTPLIAGFALLGMVRVWRERPDARWLLWASWVPTAYYAFRGAVLLDFTPAARFTALQLILWLPFIGPGFDALFANASKTVQRVAAGTALALLAGMTAWLGVFTFRVEGKYQTSLRPVSPTSTNPPDMMQVARFVHDAVLPTGAGIILDDDPALYMDLQIAFFGGLPEPRMARWRWEDFPRVLAKLSPEYLIRIERGTLTPKLQLSADGHTAQFQGRTYVELPGFQAPYHVYRWQH